MSAFWFVLDTVMSLFYGALWDVQIVDISCVLALDIPLWGLRKDFFKPRVAQGVRESIRPLLEG
jgi:hypothetical protein